MRVDYLADCLVQHWVTCSDLCSGLHSVNPSAKRLGMYWVQRWVNNLGMHWVTTCFFFSYGTESSNFGCTIHEAKRKVEP